MFALIPRNTAFFDQFEQAAAILNKVAEAYARLTHDYEHRTEHVALIRQLEHESDEIAHRTYDRLDQTFLTPIDREDIVTLTRRMDDVVDEIDAASKRLTLYRIPEPTPWLLKQTDVLVQACRLVGQAVRQLRNLKKLDGLTACLIEIHRLENIGDEHNHAAVAELFDRGGDPLLVMKWKEIYDLTERAVDRCEDIANTIRGIVLKNT